MSSKKNRKQNRKPVKPTRPKEITTALVGQWIEIGLGFVGGMAMLLLSFMLPVAGTGIAGVLTATAVVALLTSAGLTAVNLALRHGHNWARITGIVVHCLGAASTLFTFFANDADYRTLPGLFLAVIVIRSLAAAPSRQWCLDRGHQRYDARLRAERKAEREAERAARRQRQA